MITYRGFKLKIDEFSLFQYMFKAKYAENSENSFEALTEGVMSHPKSVNLRLAHLKLIMEIKADDDKLIMKAFDEALKALSGKVRKNCRLFFAYFYANFFKETLDLWKLAVEWTLLKHPNKLEKMFEVSLTILGLENRWFESHVR